MYITKYGKYDFPNNLSKKEMIKLLRKWKSIIPNEEEHRFYEVMIKIINGDFNVSLMNELQKKVEKEGKNSTKIHPNFILQGGTKIVNYRQQMGDEIMKEAEKILIINII